MENPETVTGCGCPGPRSGAVCESNLTPAERDAPPIGEWGDGGGPVPWGWLGVAVDTKPGAAGA